MQCQRHLRPRTVQGYQGSQTLQAMQEAALVRVVHQGRGEMPPESRCRCAKMSRSAGMTSFPASSFSLLIASRRSQRMSFLCESKASPSFSRVASSSDLPWPKTCSSSRSRLTVSPRNQAIYARSWTRLAFSERGTGRLRPLACRVMLTCLRSVMVMKYSEGGVDASGL